MTKMRNTMLSIICLGLLACQGVSSVNLLGTKNPVARDIAVIVSDIAVELVSVDGKRVALPAFANGDISYQLPPGEHELIFRYEQLWTNDDADTQVLRTPYMMANIVLKPGEKYRTRWQEPKIFSEAKAFVDSPSISLIEFSTGNEIALTKLGFKREMFDVFGNVFAGTANCVDAENGDCLLFDSEALKQLKYWWEQASDADKKAFEEFIRS